MLTDKVVNVGTYPFMLGNVITVAIADNFNLIDEQLFHSSSGTLRFTPRQDYK